MLNFLVFIRNLFTVFDNQLLVILIHFEKLYIAYISNHYFTCMMLIFSLKIVHVYIYVCKIILTFENYWNMETRKLPPTHPSLNEALLLYYRAVLQINSF